MAGIVNLLSQMFVPQTTQVVTPTRSASSNPYSNNPFVSYNGHSLNAYSKNAPVRGGYFAGYYNGKQNIVGQRLFIEV